MASHVLVMTQCGIQPGLTVVTVDGQTVGRPCDMTCLVFNISGRVFGCFRHTIRCFVRWTMRCTIKLSKQENIGDVQLILGPFHRLF